MERPAQKSVQEILASYNAKAPLAEPHTIPSPWYTDSRIAELERLNVFSRSCQFAARLEQVENPGQYVTTTVAGEPIVVVRGSDK